MYLAKDTNFEIMFGQHQEDRRLLFAGCQNVVVPGALPVRRAQVFVSFLV